MRRVEAWNLEEIRLDQHGGCLGGPGERRRTWDWRQRLDLARSRSLDGGDPGDGDGGVPLKGGSKMLGEVGELHGRIL